MDEALRGGEIKAEFQDDLLNLLAHLSIDESLISRDELNWYDWSLVTAKMVYSIPGMVSVDRSSGLPMLSRKVPSSGQPPLWVECQGSSLGIMDKTWLDNFLTCTMGKLPPISSRKRPAEDIPSSSPLPPPITTTTLRLIFPTMKYALESELGPEAFGTIFCQPKYWNNPNYPRDHFYRCLSTSRTSRPLHTKLIVTEGWYYVGSHNFTPSAWGKWVKEGSTIFIANYELGVIMMGEAKSEILPYRRPVEPYSKNDMPWMQQVVFGE